MIRRPTVYETVALPLSYIGNWRARVLADSVAERKSRRLRRLRSRAASDSTGGDACEERLDHRRRISGGPNRADHGDGVSASDCCCASAFCAVDAANGNQDTAWT